MIDFELSRLTWRKSSHSGSQEDSSCVEVAPAPPRRMIATRDSKDPFGPALCFNAVEWSGFLGQVRRGSYDL
jgi:hypothetical protein